MILQIEGVQIEQPKISLNQLGEFPFSTEKKKLEILRNQKFGNNISAPYYASAFYGILRSFKEGMFSQEILIAEAYRVSMSGAATVHQIKKRENNLKAIKSFSEIGNSANPPIGIHKIIHQNARIPLDGVIVSARPEIVTENSETRDFAFTKLRFSKSKVSADAQEIALLVLLHYGQQQSHEGLLFSMEKSRLIDCFSKTIIAGHTIGRHRYQQLHEALAEIRILWPTIRNAGDRNNRSN
jgi:hypothetical protein